MNTTYCSRTIRQSNQYIGIHQ